MRYAVMNSSSRATSLASKVSVVSLGCRTRKDVVVTASSPSPSVSVSRARYTKLGSFSNL